MWQRSAPSNQTTPTPLHNSRAEDSPSDPPIPLVEETLEFQVEYPREVVEEVEEEVAEEVAEAFLPQYRHNRQLLPEETNSSAIRRLYSQEIDPNQKSS